MKFFIMIMITYYGLGVYLNTKISTELLQNFSSASSGHVTDMVTNEMSHFPVKWAKNK